MLDRIGRLMPTPEAMAAKRCAGWARRDLRPWWQHWGPAHRKVSQPPLAGMVILSVGFSLPACLLMNGTWHRRVRPRRRRRLRDGR
jgi:hypothetical protein